jgi:hypothetical protein
VANHEDVGCSEHQIRLSKGLIAKFVQSLKLAAGLRCRNEKSHRCRSISFRRHTPGINEERLFLKEKLRQQRSSIRRSGNGTGVVAFSVSNM